MYCIASDEVSCITTYVSSLLLLLFLWTLPNFHRIGSAAPAYGRGDLRFVSFSIRWREWDVYVCVCVCVGRWFGWVGLGKWVV